MQLEQILKQFRADGTAKFRLDDIDPGYTCGLDIDKDDAKELLEEGVKRLADLQERLYAQGQWAILIILQGTDASGKDSAIEHVMSGLNPQGCEVTSFKVPSDEELRHDFLWRTTRRLPERGHIGIFNRSYYEEVLTVRVHPEHLQKQNLPPKLVGDDIWAKRLKDIRNFERYLSRNGTVVLKFHLRISRKEQKRRLLERIDKPDKHWKFNAGDIRERALWDKYSEAYQDLIRETGTKFAPWYVVPSDNKWFSRLVVAGTLLQALQGLDLQFPRLDAAEQAELDKSRKALMES